jgi:hypothetical protein
LTRFKSSTIMLTFALSQVNAHDHDEDSDHDQDDSTPITQRTPQSTPSSPPPSFRSEASSPTYGRLLYHHDPLNNEEDQTLADTFDDGEASDPEDGLDDRQRLMRAEPTVTARAASEQQQQEEKSTTITATSTTNLRSPVPRRVTELPTFTPLPAAAPPPPTRHQPHGNNDGVFANLAAKPERGDGGEEKPPVSPIPPLSLPRPSSPSNL